MIQKMAVLKSDVMRCCFARAKMEESNVFSMSSAGLGLLFFNISGVSAA